LPADDRAGDVRAEGDVRVGGIAERAGKDHAGEEHRPQGEDARDDVAHDDVAAEERIERGDDVAGCGRAIEGGD